MEEEGAGAAPEASLDAEMGVDDAMGGEGVDPALALALQASMDEERARKEAEAKKRPEEGGGAGEASADGAAAATDAPMGEAAAADDDELDEEQAPPPPPPPAAIAAGRLESWTILDDGRFRGRIYGKLNVKDGKSITTSYVPPENRDFEGRMVWTESGSCYMLGAPAEPEADN